MKLKVCGMRDKDNVRELFALAPDYIGFIFYPGSERFVGRNFDKNITMAVPGTTKKVGVFVNALIEDIYLTSNKYRLDLVQLHGIEPPEYCCELSLLNIPIIKAFSVDEEFDFSITRQYMPWCSYFLFDTKNEGYGGSGKKFDWNLLGEYDNAVPFFLSGGVDIGSVERIRSMSGLNIFGLDLNSRFETKPGIKNIEKIRLFKEKLDL